MSDSTLTPENIRDRSAEQGGVHLVMLPTCYRIYYEGTPYPTYGTKAEAVAAAHALATDHINQHGAGTCDITDYTATPLTEEDIPR